MVNVVTQTEGIEIQLLKIGAQKNIALFRVQGFIDTTTSPQLHKVIAETIRNGASQIIVDLGAVTYVSSAGWGVFVGEIRGIRENGGDLKIIQMTPDVNEVFEMLEFNRILIAYDSLEEAVDDFDLCMGYDLTRPVTESVKLPAANNGFAAQQQPPGTVDGSTQAAMPAEAVEAPTEVLNSDQQPVFEEPKRFRSANLRSAPKVDDADLPLTEKIKKLVIENPINGPWAIKKMLYSPRFGYTKISYFKLRSTMKKLNLDTRSKRYRYFRSR